MAAATSRYAGKRPAGRKAVRPRRPARPGADSRGGSPAVLALQRRRTAQLVAAGTIFVALVAWKLLFPESLAVVAGTIREALGQDADFRAAFSAVGEAIAGEKSVEESLEEAYTAVFAPGRYAAEQTAAVLAAAEGVTAPADRLRERLETESVPRKRPAENREAVERPESTASQSLVQFDSAGPANVTFSQQVLGFAYTTPARGTLTSSFGYREHPIEGEELFHYGLDIANTEGTEICAFADGTVKATGKSSSFGNYLMLSHANGYTTLYGHCSKVTVSAGQSVKKGEKIAEMGSTGNVTGTHLHFELMDGSTYLNPIYYVEIH